MEKKLWFKAKTYGWGWTPATWQGWLVLFVYIVIIVRFTLISGLKTQPVSELLLNLFIYSIIPTILLILICFKKGEKPHWSWGENRKQQK